MALASFFAGATLGGALVRDSALQLGHRYGLALLVEALLLFAAVPLIHQHDNIGLWLAAMACGLQNAMVSTYSGAVVRTTHVSGTVTDLGILLGRFLRGADVDKRRAALYSVLFFSFLSGGLIGALAFPYWHERTLLAPATLAVLTAAGYMAFLARRRGA